MLLRFQKAVVRGNYATGNQAFSMRLRFLPYGTRVPQQTNKIVIIGNLCQSCYSELEIYIHGEGLGHAYTKRQFDRRA